MLNAAGSLDTSALVTAAKALDIDTVIGHVQYNDRGFSVQPLATGQWIYDNTTMSWKQEIIAAAEIEGLDATAEFQPF